MLTAQRLNRVFRGFPVRTGLALNPGVHVNVNPAGWETCAIEQSVLCGVSLAHVQEIQRSASAMNTTLAQRAKSQYVVLDGNVTTEVTALIVGIALVLKVIQDLTVRLSVSAAYPASTELVRINTICVSVNLTGDLRGNATSTKDPVSTAPRSEGVARKVPTRASATQDIQVSIALPEPVMGVNTGVVSVARYFPKNVNAT